MRKAKSTIQTATMTAKVAASLREKFLVKLPTANVVAVATEAATAQMEAVLSPRATATVSSSSSPWSDEGAVLAASTADLLVLIVVVAITIHDFNSI